MKHFSTSREIQRWLVRRWLIAVGSFLLGGSTALLLAAMDYHSRQVVAQPASSIASPQTDAATTAQPVAPQIGKQSAGILRRDEPQNHLLPANRPQTNLPQKGVQPTSPALQLFWSTEAIATYLNTANGRPQLSPLPPPQETWQCEVVVVGGSLGGVSAAAHAMQSGARTCLIEAAPWLGGQISAQGVSAIDQSKAMSMAGNFSPDWLDFKERIRRQPVQLPDWDAWVKARSVNDINSCWVGTLCFPPRAAATASEQLLRDTLPQAPGSRWGTAIAFKGAEFDPTGRIIAAIYAVKRIPRQSNYRPQGRLSVELTSWYAWESDSTFQKVPIRLAPPPGKRMIVIDATDTGELVAWAQIPHKVGSDSRLETGEVGAAMKANPDCTQAFTYPFALAIRDDGGKSKAALDAIAPFYNRHEHLNEFSLEGTPMFTGKSFFNYRRIVSTTRNDPFAASPQPGDITMVNWTRGNDWNWMNPPLILTPEKLAETDQYRNWMGGLSQRALRHAENHALLFADWLLNTQAKPGFPLMYLAGVDSPMGTVSGLSMVPYIREGRRILGRAAYGQSAFMMREADVRKDMQGRDFSATAIALTHYDIDIHGCRYRNWEPTGEAQNASVHEHLVRPVKIPLEALIPQGVDNVMIGGKAIAVTHIVNAVTRLHYGEWGIGAAAGGTAGWLIRQNIPLMPPEIIAQKQMPQLQQHLRSLGQRLHW